MYLEPTDLYEKLEFDKILELLQRECLGDLAVQKIPKLTLYTQKFMIETQLNEVNEFKRSIEEKDHFPISTYHDLRKDLRLLEIVDAVLSEEGLQRINTILLTIRDIFTFFKGSKKTTYPKLYDIIRHVTFDASLIDAIEKVIDAKGEIKADASPELTKIRNKIAGKHRELEKQFRSLISEYKQKGWLSDSIESFRNGRRVLSVPSEHKRKIRGIIHDESATGKTAFIEPEAIISINNDIFDLANEEKREIYRILKELSAVLRPYVPIMDTYQSLLIRLDIVQAKARLALKLNANKPKLKDHPHLSIERGFHPLLFLKNKNTDKVTVPFDLKLFGANRILVLSGPNAGGKSITMKSLGLLQLMLQAGMLIPVSEESEMGIFEKMFADIGDSQSLEDDLSTYSSRLKNMKGVLENADEKSLVLIDEFGSGTDPKIGGAIAEAILRQLNFSKIYGFITTHYSNLKVFAFKNKGIVNASMLFDKDKLTPTYEFKVGRPGSSYAYEIAEKSGLGEKILKYAKHKTGKNEKAIDELLIDLQREKQELDDKLTGMSERENKLEKLIKNYEHLYKDLTFKRKKLKLEVKEQSLQQVAHDNKALEKLIREIREEKNLEKAKEMALKVRTERTTISSDVTKLKEDIYHQPASTKEREIKIGDFVKLKTGGATGTVQSIQKKKAIVIMGIMTMTVHLRDLIHANEPLNINSKKSIHMDVVASSAKFESKLDLRGLRRDDALKVLEVFVDKAIVSSVTHLNIVHGKGDGILRKAVWKKLREYDAIQGVSHPEPENGGDGVTIVEL